MLDERAHWAPSKSSDRAFGLVFAAVFFGIACFPLLSGDEVRIWSLALATTFGLVAVARPAWLSLLNHGWAWLGLQLGNIVSPIALGIVYCLSIVPIGLIIRIVGQDPLRLKFDPKAETYWISRKPPGPRPETMRQQF